MVCFLSVDAGTTASKVALFKQDGELLASSTREYELITPSPLEVEIDAETLWRAFTSGVHEVLESGVRPDDKKQKISWKERSIADSTSRVGSIFLELLV